MSLMREIMTNAHKAKRELGLTLSSALKCAWADARAKYAKKEEEKSMEEEIIALFKGASVTKVRVWEKGSYKRLYLTVAGVSSYQHNKGNMFVEFISNALNGTGWKIGNNSISIKTEQLAPFDFESMKRVFA